MSRAEELWKRFSDVEDGKRIILEKLIDEAVFIEGQMEELKKYPFIKFHPTNPSLQKVTAAGKQYREYLQTYTNIISKLCSVYSKSEDGDKESPLREFADFAKDMIAQVNKK